MIWEKSETGMPNYWKNLILPAGLSLALFASPALATDPVLSDPSQIDAAHPPATLVLPLKSHGSRLNASIFLANGAGPHPTVLLLHGFPGYEKNLDLGQSLRRAGFNVLFFHYRGSWSSEGQFSFTNVLEDVQSALSFLREPASRSSYRVDSDRLVLFGHSMGGFAALVGAAIDTGVICTAAVSPFNVAASTRILRQAENAETRAGFTAFVDNAVPINGISGAALLEEAEVRGDAWDISSLGPQFRGRQVLLVGAQRDRVLPTQIHYHPVVERFSTDPAIKFTHHLMDGDHAYSWTRIALTRVVTEWMVSNCQG
jgi:pimeloyl-ACP methyl ester carboxylesterase